VGGIGVGGIGVGGISVGTTVGGIVGGTDVAVGLGGLAVFVGGGCFVLGGLGVEIIGPDPSGRVFVGRGVVKGETMVGVEVGTGEAVSLGTITKGVDPDAA
jgi:hypothetical protein